MCWCVLVYVYRWRVCWCIGVTDNDLQVCLCECVVVLVCRMRRKDSFLHCMGALCLLWATLCCQMIWDIHEFDVFNHTGPVDCWLSPRCVPLNHFTLHRSPPPLFSPPAFINHPPPRRSPIFIAPPAAHSPIRHKLIGIMQSTNVITCWWCLVIMSRFYATTVRNPPRIVVNSLAFGGRGCYFSKRRKKFGRGIFDATLGYPGEGPGKETQEPTKRSRGEVLQRSAGHIDLNATENDVWVQVNDTVDAEEIVIAINAERSGLKRAGVLRALVTRHIELTQAQRTLLNSIDLSQSQHVIASQVRHSEDVAEMKQALAEETQHANRTCVLRLLRARIGQVQSSSSSSRYGDTLCVKVEVNNDVVVVLQA